MIKSLAFAGVVAGKMSKLLAYIRYSDNEDLLKQKKRIQAFADLSDLELSETIEEENSIGENLHRTFIQEFLSKLKDESISGVITTSLDRFCSRATGILRIIYKIKKFDKNLYSIDEKIDTTKPVGAEIFSVLIKLSEYEEERSGEFKKSEKLGTSPLGFESVYNEETHKNELVPVLKELEIIEEIVNNRKDSWSLRSISDNLNNRGVLPKRGKRWYPATIRHILNSDKTKEKLKILEEMRSKEKEKKETEVVESGEANAEGP